MIQDLLNRMHNIIKGLTEQKFTGKMIIEIELNLGGVRHIDVLTSWREK